MTIDNISHKRVPLLPKRGPQSRPLFVILTVMAFLTALTLVISAISYRSVQDWKSHIERTASLYITNFGSEERQALATRSLQILQSQNFIEQSQIVSETRAKALLQPWLGNVTLPADLPMPILISLKIKQYNPQNLQHIIRTLDDANINARITDNRQWGEKIEQTGRTLQIAILTILILVIASTVATTMFATQFGLIYHGKIISVLTQIGTQHNYIVRLFFRQFFIAGLLSACFGTALAVMVCTAFSTFSQNLESDSLFGLFQLQTGDILHIIYMPLVFALFSAGIAALTCRSLLRRLW